MQLEVLRRALWVQQAHPDTVFNWQFWERAAHDPKMTSYLMHGVKAKMSETTPFVNSVGTQYVASRAQLEQACDPLRQQGSSVKKTIGLSSVDVCDPTTLTESPSCTIAEAFDGTMFCYVEHNGCAHSSIHPGPIAEYLSIS